MLIEKYTSDWIKNFGDLKLEISKSLSGLKCKIEHIGSTAVPDLDAKPIIDIDIIFENKSEFESIKSGLMNIGYYHNGNQGIPGREVFKRNGTYENEILDSISHHLYVCQKCSKAPVSHIRFRDFLRKNAWARLQYQEMKYTWAKKANQDKKLYAKLKELDFNEFVDSTINKEAR